MKHTIIRFSCSMALLFCLTAYAEQHQNFLVTGSITVDGGDVQQIDVLLPANSYKTLDFGNGVEVKIITPTDSTHDSAIAIYVFRAIDGQNKILKSISSIVPTSFQRS